MAKSELLFLFFNIWEKLKFFDLNWCRIKLLRWHLLANLITDLSLKSQLQLITSWKIIIFTGNYQRKNINVWYLFHIYFKQIMIFLGNPPPLPPRVPCVPRRIEESQKRKGTIKDSKSAVGLAACSPRGLNLTKSTGSLFSTTADPSISPRTIDLSTNDLAERLKQIELERYIYHYLMKFICV